MNTDKVIAESIASAYAPKQTTKIAALKKLDARAKRGAQLFAYAFGVICTLLLGVGMCLSMKVIGNGSVPMTVLGIVSGVLGIAGVTANYAIYAKLLERGKRKYGADILALAKEITETAE